MINRRSLLRGMAAVAAAPLLPPIAAAAVPAVAGGARIASSAEPLLSYAVGIDDEWNWRAIKARSPQEAVDIWMGEQGLPSICEEIEEGETDDPCGDCEYCSNLHPDVVRHEEWDGQDVVIGDRLWCASGLGASCARCSDEAWLENGGFFDANGKLVCEACETPADHAARTGEAGA